MSKGFDRVHLQWFADDDGDKNKKKDNEKDDGKENGKDKQAVTAEQLEELKKQLEETKKAQSGSDKRVKELQEQLKQKELEAQEAEKSAEQKMAERLAALEEKATAADQRAVLAQQKAIAIDLLGKEGLKAPKFLDRIIGGNDEETQALVSDYIEDRKSVKQEAAIEYAKQNGRTVTDPDKGGYGGMTYEQMQHLSDEEFRKIPQNVVDKAVEAAMKK